MKPTKTSLRARMKDDHNGALVATGKVTLRGGAAMKADSLAAVLAGDDLTIAGTAGVPSNFTGLLYTEGDLALSNTRTVGAAVGAGTEDGGSKMTIVDSEVLSSPEGQNVEILIQDFAPSKLGGAGSKTDSELIIEPRASDLLVNGRIKAEPEYIQSLIKIRYQGTTYDSIDHLGSELSGNERKTILVAYGNTVKKWTAIAKQLVTQHEKKPVEIIRFDLNEFLNVSDRLRSSRPFYIEG